MGSKKIRVYDLAKELKIDNKRAIEEIRREGVDVSVPSNTVPDDVAERVRNKFFPQKRTTPAAPRLIKTAKSSSEAARPAAEQASQAEPLVTPDHSAVPIQEEAPAARPSQPTVRVLKAAPRVRQPEPVETKPEDLEFDEEDFVQRPPLEEVDEGVVPEEPAAALEEPETERTPGGFRVRTLSPTARPAQPEPARPAAQAGAPPRAGQSTVRVLTPKPGMEGIRPTAAPMPRPQPVPGRPAPGFEGSSEGPAKAPSLTTYIPPKDTKGRPKGLRGRSKGQPQQRPGKGPIGRDRQTQQEAHQPQLSRSAGLGLGPKRGAFTELKPVKLVEGTTLKDFAEKLDLKPRDVVAALLGRGVMATINQTLNQEVAIEVGKEFGYDVSFVQFEEMVADEELIGGDTEVGKVLETRAPVVTIMGHVDHGKTSLLDAIRSARVAEGEAGGITQHISAFSVEISDPDDRERQRRIVFIDTPGHEAFTAMRARGAKVTDVVVLVVAADDGVMPQTIEAIDHAKAADVPIIVAVNKIDKAEANPDRVKQELSERGLLWDQWGGETVMVDISAKKKINLDLLLEMIVLTADLRELKASTDRLASGYVLDAFLDKGRGAVATVLVQNGTLRVGDPFIVGSVMGRVRAMFDDRGRRIDEVGPATPVQVLGADGVPHAGDVFQVVDDIAKAQHISSFRQSKQRMERIAADSRRGIADLFDPTGANRTKELQVILKADVQGSVEAVRETIEKLSTEKVKIRVVRAGVGAITESDVMLASAANKDMDRSAVIIGFNVRPEARAEEVAKNEAVEVRLHTIIYKVQEELRDAMVGMLDKQKKEVALGRAEIRDVIRVPKIGQVAGCMVLDGLVKRGAEARLVRDNMVIYTGRVESLRRFKEDVGEVKQGFECGIVLERYQDVRVNDVIEVFRTEEVAQTEL